MEIFKISKMVILKFVLWVIMFFSGLSLVYLSHWFYKFNIDPVKYKPMNTGGILPNIWFPTQIMSYMVFLFVGYSLFRLFSKYKSTGYFGYENLKLFDYLIFACLLLAVLGAGQLAITNYYQMYDHFASPIIYLNAFARFCFKLFDAPETLFLLLAMVLWAVKQFVGKALEIKSENEKFI